MKLPKIDFKQYILMPLLAFVIPLVANAESFMGEGPGHYSTQPFAGMAPHSRHCKDDGEIFPFLPRLDLSESQQDKVFSLLNAQAQTLYDQEKIVRHAHADLHKLATSGQYDDSKAGTISESLAKAEATIALIHAREENGIYALLSPEQRNRLGGLQDGHSASGPEGMRTPEGGWLAPPAFPN